LADLVSQILVNWGSNLPQKIVSSRMVGILISFAQDQESQLLKSEAQSLQQIIYDIEDLQIDSYNINNLWDEFCTACQDAGSAHLGLYLSKFSQYLYDQEHKSYDKSATLNSLINHPHRNDNKTDLFYAVEAKCYERSVDIILSNGANPNYIHTYNDTKNISVLELVIENINPKALKSLLKSDLIDINTISDADKKIINNPNMVMTSKFLFSIEQEYFIVLGP
jgi:hypothetical protein